MTHDRRDPYLSGRDRRRGNRIAPRSEDCGLCRTLPWPALASHVVRWHLLEMIWTLLVFVALLVSVSLALTVLHGLLHP